MPCVKSLNSHNSCASVNEWLAMVRRSSSDVICNSRLARSVRCCSDRSETIKISTPVKAAKIIETTVVVTIRWRASHFPIRYKLERLRTIKGS